MMLNLHIKNYIAKFFKCSREEIFQANANQSPIFAIFVEYSPEKNVVHTVDLGLEKDDPRA